MTQRITLFVILTLCTFCFYGNCKAGGGPENLVLAVNADSESSKLIANYYIQLRDISPRNVVYLTSVPKEGVTTFDKFKNQILSPIIKHIQDQKLTEQIDYIVYSSDFPNSVRIGQELNALVEAFEQNSSQKFNRSLFAPTASINSLTYFARQIMAGDKSYLSLQANFYMRTRNRGLLTRPFVGEPQKQFEEALSLARKEDLGAAIEKLVPLAQQHPNQIAVSYWLARIFAQKQDAESTIKWLKQAIASGWSHRNFTKSDQAFEPIATDPGFQTVVATIPDNSFELMPSRAFRSHYRWGPNGMINATDEQGISFVLSTVLAVTGMRGTSEREALDQIIRTVNADGTHPKGTFYFTETGNVRSKTRAAAVVKAVKELKELGYRAEIVKSAFPKHRRDIVGLTTGTTGFDFPASLNRIVPGAICENLTSYGGRFEAAGHTPLTEFIAAGAAGSSGTVVEPFAIANKFPDPRIHVHYVNGCSLAEAFYQSVHGPFQLIIVGDPLCQPWAVFPKFALEGLTPGDTVSGSKKLSFDFSKSPVRIASLELYLDGQLVLRKSSSNNFNFKTAEISDGYHELRVVGIAQNSIETRGRVIIPFFVSNKDNKVTLTHDDNPVSFDDSVEIKAVANCGDKLELLQNDRVVATASGRDSNFKITARELGRGPVTLIARAINSEETIYSNPVSFKVVGKISSKRVPVPVPAKK